MAFCLYELAKNQNIQDKVRQEIDGVLGGADLNNITYEMISSLKYMECCLNESLRRYPSNPVHFRRATKNYTFPGTKITIPKGTDLMIPVMGFHLDPEIYDDPMVFKPERFLNSSHGDGKVRGLFYTPFGAGPRNCIGLRLGKLIIKHGLAIMLSKFIITLKDDLLNRECVLQPNQFNLKPKDLFIFKVTPR